MAIKFQRCLIPVSKDVWMHYETKRIGEKYYKWFWLEFSKAKTKRRKANKLARKQRKINNKNR